MAEIKVGDRIAFEADGHRTPRWRTVREIEEGWPVVLFEHEPTPVHPDRITAHYPADRP